VLIPVWSTRAKNQARSCADSWLAGVERAQNGRLKFISRTRL